jgi:hypothetical protein
MRRAAARTERFTWNISRTAHALGMSRNTLYRKIHKHGIVPAALSSRAARAQRFEECRHSGAGIHLTAFCESNWSLRAHDAMGSAHPSRPASPSISP